MSRRVLGVVLLLLAVGNTWLGAGRVYQGVVGRRAEWDIRDARLDSAWRRLEGVRWWQPAYAPSYVLMARAVSQARANGLRMQALAANGGRPDTGVGKALLARAIDLSPADAWAWFTLAEAGWAEEAARDRLRRLRSVVTEGETAAEPEPAGLRPMDRLILAATREAQWLEPGWYFYHDFLARLMDRRGEQDLAAREIASAYALMPRPSVHEVLGEEILGRYPGALEEGLARAEAQGRLDPVSLAWGRAETREFLGQDDAAIAAWRDLRQIVDRDSRALCDYAVVRILARAHRDEESLPALEMFVQDHAGDRLMPAALRLLAEARSRLGDHAGAVAALRRSLASAPRPAAVLILMGRESELMGNSAEAERLYRAAVAREPDWLVAVRSLAVFLDGAGRREEALEVAREHLRRHPGDPASERLEESLSGRPREPGG